MNATERFEKVNVDKLVPYARNARTYSKELKVRVPRGSVCVDEGNMLVTLPLRSVRPLLASGG